MIALSRLPEPDILRDKKAEWTAKYLAERTASPQKRPSSKQYAHPEIVRRLEAMSCHKCFYCEQSTKQTRKEVDHHVEVAERPERAFDWANLYLSCFDCNHGKQPNVSIPVAACLDPCDSTTDPAEHLTFDDEFIAARSDSARGRQTIRKYQLDRPELDSERRRQLRLFDQMVIKIQRSMIAESRQAMKNGEKEALKLFQQADRPFSLMSNAIFRARACKGRKRPDQLAGGVCRKWLGRSGK